MLVDVTDRTLFYAAIPEVAFLITRDRRIPARMLSSSSSRAEPACQAGPRW